MKQKLYNFRNINHDESHKLKFKDVIYARQSVYSIIFSLIYLKYRTYLNRMVVCLVIYVIKYMNY